LFNSLKSEIQVDSKNTNIAKPVLIITLMVSLTISFLTSALNISLPAVNREFQADAISLSWVVTAYTLAIAVFSIPFSRVADITGRKKVFIWGSIVFTIISAITILSKSIGMFICCRSIQGISSAMLQGTSIAMLTSSYPANKRGRVLGLSIACVFLGGSIGPVLGGLLTEHLGWRSIFVVSVLTGFTLFTITIWKIKTEWIEAKGARFDYKGSIIFGVALVALIYGLSLLPGILGVVVAVSGIAGLLVFIKWESIVQSPILDIKLFRNNKVFVLSNIATIMMSCSSFALAFLLSLYLQYVKGLTAEIAGSIFLVIPVTQAALSPFAGRISDRIAPYKVASSGMAFMTFGLLMLFFLNSNTSLLQICAVFIVLGIGTALFNSPNSNAIFSSVLAKHYTVVASLANTTRTIGNTLSMSITMIVFALVIGRISIAPEYSSEFLTSTKVIFGIFTLLCFSGILISLASGAKNTKIQKSSNSPV
jgi:EmrB/QacA subfamily drug resistance transporter